MGLDEQGLLTRAGTIAGAIIIAAPSWTKNEGKTRDPEMQETKRGRERHVGMKSPMRQAVIGALLKYQSWWNIDALRQRPTSRGRARRAWRNACF